MMSKSIIVFLLLSIYHFPAEIIDLDMIELIEVVNSLKEFNFDLTELIWSSYIRNYCIGAKKYLLKENLLQSSIKTSPKRSFIKAKYILYLITYHSSN